jgi:hypothetical protein
VREIVCCFAAHLRTTRLIKGHPIKSVTIDQYITHVADYLVTNEHILRGDELRSRRLSMLLAGYTAGDDVGVPLRLRQKIPMTYPIACIMYRLAATMHTGAKRLALRAALAMAFGLSLRPAEYLVMEEDTPLSHQANASACFFVFNDDECVCVCDPHLYPVGRTPSFSLCMLTHLKNDKKGEGGPKAVGRAPSSSLDHFCCVLTLFAYFKAHPGRRETLALSAHGPGVAWSEMRHLCHLAASEAGLDPTRLVPHSARAGALAQFEDESDVTRQQQGGWLSHAGMQAYARKALGHARAVAAVLHDVTVCPLAQTRMMFSTHPVGPSGVGPER